MFLQRARAQLFCRCRTSPIARGDLYYRALLSFSTVTGNTNANERLQDHGSNTTSRAFEETPNEAQIVEVSPRDGLQNEREVSVEDRVQLIKLLAAAGCNKIEAGSFVKPEAVPSMKNTKEVMMALEEFRKEKGEKLKLSCLVPKDNYMQDAIDVRTDEVAVFTSASETFALKNINCGIEKSIERFQPIVELAREHGMPVRGYV
jgi:hydroxymethylglutaryl-CoA lyase